MSALTAAQLGIILAGMASRAQERAEYLQARSQHGFRAAPAAEAVAWTLRSILMEGAQQCVKIAQEEAK